ncbi:MAG: SLBB domain-containing protein [Proteobacteria bacterium]|nr:SLBB domain-containing protein [Pseudomonadota bacterium]
MNKTRLQSFVSALTAGALAAAPVLAQPTAATPPDVPAAQPGAAAAGGGGEGAANWTYILGPEDVIEVSVVGRTDFTTRLRIRSDGTIELPYVGKRQAADKSAPELADLIGKGLAKAGIYANPVVNVEIVGYASRYVTVLGAVAQPGLVPINRPYRISEIVARVGGLRENAAEYIIERPPNGPERRIYIKQLATGDEKDDPYVQAGDKIYAPVAELFYISGQVHQPGGFTFTSDMTVRQAIARGGGLTDEGSDKRVKINRKGKVVDHVTLDTKIEPGDVVIVGERIF